MFAGCALWGCFVYAAVHCRGLTAGNVGVASVRPLKIGAAELFGKGGNGYQKNMHHGDGISGLDVDKQ